MHAMYNFIHSVQHIDEYTSICNNGYSSLDPWPYGLFGSSVIEVVCCVDNSTVLCSNLKY